MLKGKERWFSVNIIDIPYERVSFPVLCVNGIFADAATGKKLFFDEESLLF